jgi:hypothetical protein
MRPLNTLNGKRWALWPHVLEQGIQLELRQSYTYIKLIPV